jgi:hypothetical protein
LKTGLQQALRTALREAMHSSNVKKPPTAIAEGGDIWRKRWLSNQIMTGLGRFFTCRLNVYPVIFDRIKLAS